MSACPIHGTDLCPATQEPVREELCAKCQESICRIRAGKSNGALDRDVEVYLLAHALRGMRKSLRNGRHVN